MERSGIGWIKIEPVDPGPTHIFMYSNVFVDAASMMRVRNCPLKDSDGRVFMNKHEYGHLMVR